MILKKDDYSISEDRQSITISLRALHRIQAHYSKRACEYYREDLKVIGVMMHERAALANDLINLFYEDDEQK